MSKRGRDFLSRWIDDNVPDNPSADPALITDLADRAMEDARLQGIAAHEVDEEVHSLFARMVQAVAEHKAGRV